MSGPWAEIALGEEAAVYAYGVLAGQLSDPERTDAVHTGIAHSRARDRARAALAADDEQPNAPAVFEIPFPMDGASAARNLAELVESRLVEVYCLATPDLAEADRHYAAHMAQESAARAVRWGARPQAFPGATDPSPEPAAPPPSGATRSPAAATSVDDSATVG